MIPIKDEIRSRRVAIVNYILIALNVFVFLIELMQGANIEAFMNQYALIPSQISSGLDAGDIVRVFTSMFMHGGWMHLLGNMLYLWIFGDNIEDALGHFGYLAFYLLSGIVAAFTHYYFNPQSLVPTVGASGAIAGVLGAYLVFYPSSRVYTFIPIGFFSRLTLVPSFIVLGMWFALQLFNGFLSIGAADQGGVAFWAHIGGFVFGLLVGILFKHRAESASGIRRW
ncbi:MAG: rhomboid family intramembrane serine protease [Anaerolineaceae bacterium]|nr:rhomboid family intramembrane serine protease [Anaerolineaceae bacterium]